MVHNFNYGNEIKIIFENEEFAVLYKPRGIASAPLLQSERGTLVNRFLSLHPECAVVKGKKQIEAGLIHRLDTATSGLVLFAKTQAAYNEFTVMQKNNFIQKTYFAFIDIENEKMNKNISEMNLNLPYRITSRFRSFGPKGKKVMPIFDESHKFTADGKLYTTNIVGIKKVFKNKYSIVCSLTQGFRHQIRSHLAYLGFPICGDALYNSNYKSYQEELEKHDYPLQLYAVGISFPKPESFSKEKAVNDCISFSLPPPNKMIP